MTSNPTSAPSVADVEVRRGQELLEAGEIEPAREAFERAIDLQPDHVLAAVGLAQALLAEGAFTDAKDLYEAAFAAGLEKSARHLTNLGICYAFEGERPTARTLIEGAIATDPNYEPAYGALARHCVIMGDHRAAERYATEGLRLFPVNLPCREARALARLAMLNLDAAAADAESALQLDPQSVDALQCKAAVLLARQQVGPALEVLQQAESIAPDDAEVLLSAGSAHQIVGDFEAAEERFQKAREFEPANWRVYQALAALALVREEAAAGLEHVDLALELQDAPVLHYLRGALLRLEGRDGEAKEEFKRATQASPIDALSWVELAELEARVPAERAAAIEHARAAERLDPEGEVGKRSRRVRADLGA